jgi:hypothetical protein
MCQWAKRERQFMKLVSILIFSLFLSLSAFATEAKTPDPAKPATTVETPKLTDAQKLAVRAAQVDFYEAKNAKDKADADFAKAQEALTKAVNSAFSEVKQEDGFFLYKGKKFGLSKDLDFTPIAEVKK